MHYDAVLASMCGTYLTKETHTKRGNITVCGATHLSWRDVANQKVYLPCPFRSHFKCVKRLLLIKTHAHSYAQTYDFHLFPILERNLTKKKKKLQLLSVIIFLFKINSNLWIMLRSVKHYQKLYIIHQPTTHVGTNYTWSCTDPCYTLQSEGGFISVASGIRFVCSSPCQYAANLLECY